MTQLTRLRARRVSTFAGMASTLCFLLLSPTLLAQEETPSPPAAEDAAPDELTATPASASSPTNPANPANPARPTKPTGQGDGHGDPNRYAIDVDQSPTAVVEELIAAATAGDEIGYVRHLSRRFVDGIEVLRSQPGPEGADAWSWTVFLQATAAPELVEKKEIVFYERASVRVVTADGRSLKFRLVVEDKAWRVDLPEPLEALVAARLPPKPDHDGTENDDADGADGETRGEVDDHAAVGNDDSGQAASADAIAKAEQTPGAADVTAPIALPPHALSPDALPSSNDGSALPPEPVAKGFFDAGGPGHYFWYLPDYAAVGLSALGVAVSITQEIAPPWILLGPDYNLDRPNPVRLLDERLDLTIGRPMVQEKVPDYFLVVAGISALTVFSALDIARHLEFHHLHAFVLGAVESAVFTLAFTEMLKLGVGRLRPDFRERFSRAACGGYVEAPSSFDCSAAPQDGFVVTRSGVIDGMKSFPSGHASMSFAMATYFSLYLGGEYIWGDQARAWTMPLAALAIGAMYTAAGFVSASRVADNRHFIEDVVVGAGLGSAVAAGTYFLHFDLDGKARWRSFRFSAAPLDGGGGAASISGNF